MLEHLEKNHSANGVEENVRGRSRSNTLRDRFKLQRMKEQAGIDSLDEIDGGVAVPKPGISSTDGQPANGSADAGAPPDQQTAGVHRPGSSSPAPLASPRIDLNLAPGTAAGISAGPPSVPDAAAHIDWDLWQSLVYEGPAIVAQKSSEELSQAIAGGIPSAIRGVVWQVLANSQDPDLEKVFRDLAGRSPETASRKKLPVEKPEHPQPNDVPVDGSLASVTSNDSRTEDGEGHGSATAALTSPTLSATNGAGPLPSGEAENKEPLTPSLTTPAHQPESNPILEDAAALQKLEKAIKRDLGARTSFSKYAASAGLQDSLFRVCKAYALYDKDVGYAQGMNFLAMPLLFNVSRSHQIDGNHS